MFELICTWLYENAVAIFISAIASLLISKRYYDKGNREDVLMNVIFPIVRLLDKSYTKVVYEELFDLKTSYAVRYLHKNERNKLLKLVDAYRAICKYSKEGADTDAVMSYYSYKLKQNGINPRPCPIRDDEGDIVASDFPPYYNDMVNQVYEIISSFEFVESPNECARTIAKEFSRYTKEWYTEEKITFFDEYSIEKVIELSEVTKKWKNRFEELETCKKNFLELSLCKKALNIVNESKTIKK